MIHFIDLRASSDDLGGARFAFWDTLSDLFVLDGTGCCVWVTLAEFEYWPTGLTKVCVATAPVWTMHAMSFDAAFALEVQERPEPICKCCDEEEVAVRRSDPDYEFEPCFCECHLTVEQRLEVRTSERDRALAELKVMEGALDQALAERDGAREGGGVLLSALLGIESRNG